MNWVLTQCLHLDFKMLFSLLRSESSWHLQRASHDRERNLRERAPIFQARDQLRLIHNKTEWFVEGCHFRIVVVFYTCRRRMASTCKILLHFVVCCWNLNNTHFLWKKIDCNRACLLLNSNKKLWYFFQNFNPKCLVEISSMSRLTMRDYCFI